MNYAHLSTFLNLDTSIDVIMIPMNADTMAQALVLKSQSMIKREAKRFIR